MESNSSSSDHDEDSKPKRGPTIKPKAHRGKPIITYNKRGVPIGPEAKKLTAFEGRVGRTMVPITYASWLDVGEEIKEDLWRYVSTHFVVDPRSRKHTLQSIGTKWKTFKYNLYRKFIKKHKNDPKAIQNPPARYPFLKKEDWKLFVAQRTSKKWEEKSKKAQNVRAQYKYNHHLSRKGYAGLLDEITQQTGKTEEEIDRATLWKKARELKTGGFEPNVQIIVDRIDELHNSESCGEVTSGTHDVLTQALGTEEQRGRVRGMGKFVKPHQYFFIPKTVKQYLDTEKKKVDQRFNKLEAELEKLKRGMNNFSEGASCQMRSSEDVENEPLDELLDNSCYLAVDIASNIVAKGTLIDYSATGENIEVMVEFCVQGEALLPIPLEDEFIVEVKDAVGHILSWPRHLVIRCSDLIKVVAKPMGKNAKPVNVLKSEKDRMNDDKGIMRSQVEKEKEVNKKAAKKSKKEKKRLRESDKESKKEKRKKKEIRKEEINENEMIGRKMTREHRKKRIRIDKSVALKMTAMMVDGKVSKVESIKVQCEDDLFGYESYTYLTWDDFEAVFTLNELSGAVITSYMMCLYEQIKNGQKRDYGFCFVNPTAISPRKSKSITINYSCRSIADRLSKRNGNDIIILPYNPGRHWVLAVLDMKTTTCYYLDSLRPSNVNPQLRQIIDAAMLVYVIHSGSKKVVNLNWVNVRCPCQPGSTECGYYILKFMKEIVDEGLKVLVNDNIGGRKDEYTDADIDGIREEWSTFVANFIFR